MRWLTVLLLWVAAIVVAVVILRRVRRGKSVVLTGRWSPHLVRMIAVVLVVLGGGEEWPTPEASAAPTKLPIRGVDDELPKSLTAYAVQSWLAYHEEGSHFRQSQREVARALGSAKLSGAELEKAMKHAATASERLRALVRADLIAIAQGKVPSRPAAIDIRAALDELEKAGQYDHHWNAYLWRKSATAEFADDAARVDLYARFRQHARITDALIRARAQVRPIMQPPRAWMSKAGPRPEDRRTIDAYQASLTDMLRVAAELLPATDEGTWKRDGVALIRPVKDSTAPVIVRGGRDRVMPADESSRFGRLDLLKTGDEPAMIVHDWLGKIELPANRLVSVWDLPKLLPDAAKQKLDEAVNDALKTNSEESADRLERSLAVSHFAVRAGLRELPNAKGAPRLRLILALFDDAVMPALPVRQPGDAVDEFGPGLRGLRGGPGGR